MWPIDHVFTTATGSEDFNATAPLVLMRNAQPDIALELTATPANLPITWKALRNPVDDGSIGGAGDRPTLTPDAGNKLKATLGADQKGSFRVRPFIDCNGSGDHEDREPSIPMNLVLVDATLFADRSIVTAGNMTDRITAGSFGYGTGAWPVTGAPLTAGDLAGACMAFDIDADVTGGGADGKLGLDSVFAGLVNNEWIEHNDAAFLDSTASPNVAHTMRSIYAANLTSARGLDFPGGSPVFLPAVGAVAADPAAVLIPLPVLDSGRGGAGLGGESATMGRSFAHTLAAVQPAKGQRWTIRCIDSPGNPFPRAHPANANAILRHVQMHMQFVGNFCFWTNLAKSRGSSGGAARPADRVYSVLRTVRWDVAGEWAIDYSVAPPTFTRVSYTATTVPATVSPVGRAQDNNVEVRPPSTVSDSILGYDGTEMTTLGGCSLGATAPGHAVPFSGGAVLVMAAILAMAALRRRRRPVLPSGR